MSFLAQTAWAEMFMQKKGTGALPMPFFETKPA
jgi:hypothetical protein